jgi:hypothetical protein
MNQSPRHVVGYCREYEQREREEETYIERKGFVNCFEGKDVFAAVFPSLAVMRVDVGENMRKPVLEFRNSIAVGIEPGLTVSFSVYIATLQRVGAVARDEKLDAEL